MPFVIICDKGCRARLAVWRVGKQRVLQPVLAESDKQFGRDDALLTAAVAHVVEPMREQLMFVSKPGTLVGVSRIIRARSN